MIHIIKEPEVKKDEGFVDYAGNTLETTKLKDGCNVACKQCRSLQCCCAGLTKMEGKSKRASLR